MKFLTTKQISGEIEHIILEAKYEKLKCIPSLKDLPRHTLRDFRHANYPITFIALKMAMTCYPRYQAPAWQRDDFCHS